MFCRAAYTLHAYNSIPFLLRKLFTWQGYVLCSLDKLVMGLLQNLYRASGDKVFHKLTQLYYYERTTQSEGVTPAIYRGHAQELLSRSEKEVRAGSGGMS